MSTTNTHKIKVLVVDDHAIVRSGLETLLATSQDLDVVGTAANGKGALAAARKTHPDVILMDLMMPVMDGTETTKRLQTECPSAKVLIITTFGTADALSHALDAGATGAVIKNIKLPGLLEAIRRTARGERYLSPEISQMLTNSRPIPELSDRQLEILHAISIGRSNDDICTQFGISRPTVRDHLHAIFTKIGAANRAEAVGIALRKHLLKI